MFRQVFLLLIFVHQTLWSGAQSNRMPPDRPNIILVYLDDMGYGDLGLTGATGFETPHINKLATEGAFLTHFYSPQAVCSASRLGLLTGCYPNRLGFSGALDHTATIGINGAETTIAEMLKPLGYATAAFGKWHLGHTPEFLPLRHGFDEYFGIPYSNDMWPQHPISKNYYPPLPLIDGEKVVATDPDQSQFTTRFTERTLQFIEKHRSQPFFIYLAHPMPHVPLFVSDKFKGRSKQGLYGDVMMELDWSIGAIVKKVDEAGLGENTLIIFTSDNGPWLTYGDHAGSSGGLREGKGTTYEGGQRVPCIFRWKGTIRPGMVSD
ncbi:MAG TPA: sulfatase-like hydrolase/transferase, partial [Phnomibacter sp.]|nr:sulfatase-like hydrolase/transferase [Phnomibacter sp.]